MIFKRNKNKNDKQIVILGAGFAGIRAALNTAKFLPNSNIVLVDRKNHHLYHPDLYEVATSLRFDADALSLKGTVAIPVDDIVGHRENITFKQAVIKEVDIDRRMVRTDDGDLAYDYLVVAMGSVVDYFGVPGLAENALSLKTFKDAVKIRNSVDLAFKEFARMRDKSYLNFVIGGGGFTGVELAAELVAYLKHLSNREKGTVPMVSVWVIEGSEHLFGSMSPDLSRVVAERLEKLGVKVITNSLVTKVREDGIEVNKGKFIPARTVIWAGGVRSCTVPFSKNIPIDKKDRVIVSSRLSLESYPEVFIAGDASCWVDPSKKNPEPQTAQVAIHQAKYVARSITNLVNNQEPSIYRPKKNMPYIVPLGGKFAALFWNNRVWSGISPYILRRLADLRYFISILPLRKALPLWIKGTRIYIKND